MLVDLSEISTVGGMSLDHPEGLAVSPTGELYAGGEAGQIYRVDLESGTVDLIAQAGGFLLGLACDADGDVYACNPGLRTLQRVTPATGTVRSWSTGCPERQLVNPNWAVFDDAGNLYLTDSGTWHGHDGCILKVTATGQTSVWTTASRNFPNGACLSPDGRALVVAESNEPALVRIPIRDDGQAAEREVLARLPGTVPDGVVAAADGSLLVFCYRPDRILQVDLGGRVTVVADDPEGTVLAAPTNGAWSGREPDELVVANFGRWHLSVLRPGITGSAPRYPRLPR